MIQKRYKQTEALAQAQGLKTMIETEEVLLAKLALPDMEDMPNHRQYLIIKDVNIVASDNYIKLSPRRMLQHKTTLEELDLNLFVPDWTITSENESSHVDENGERVLFEMEHYDPETGLAVTVDENGEALPELPAAAFMIKTLEYLMFFAKRTQLTDLITMFSAQFIADNLEVWEKLKTK